MAREGAVYALMLIILSNTKNQRLAPICIQALYNLTCVGEHYKGLERIAKAMQTLPALSFDATPFILKALVNCTRFPQNRVRIIEEGAIQMFISVANTLSVRSNRSELALHLCMILRGLSDTLPCRTELLSKGSMELISQLLSHLDEPCRLLIIKTVHNLVQVIHSSPGTIFEIAVGIVCEIGTKSSDGAVLEIVSACIWNFFEVKLRNMVHLSKSLHPVLVKLLLSEIPLTKFYAINSVSQMFFNKLMYEFIALLGTSL
jgi:hypothetical protein